MFSLRCPQVHRGTSSRSRYPLIWVFHQGGTATVVDIAKIPHASGALRPAVPCTAVWQRIIFLPRQTKRTDRGLAVGSSISSPEKHVIILRICLEINEEDDLEGAFVEDVFPNPTGSDCDVWTMVRSACTGWITSRKVVVCVPQSDTHQRTTMFLTTG